MNNAWGRQLADFKSLTDYCAALPELFSGSMLAETLQSIASKPSLEPLAGLWFVRAVHELAKAPSEEEAAFLRDILFPRTKKVLQAFISAEDSAGITMDGGGLLVKPAANDSFSSMRLNALWYAGLESIAADLKKIGDRSGDHFERLSARCRRSFVKVFWSDERQTFCSPETDAARAGGTLDPDALLLTMLAASPLPGTKQRQVLESFAAKGMGHFGVLAVQPNDDIHESLLHRAWAVRGIRQIMGNEGAEKAAAVVMPLRTLKATAMTSGLPALCKNEVIFAGVGMPDPLTTVHVLAVLD